MCPRMWFHFPQTVATEQTDVTSAMVLWTDVLVEVNALWGEGGLDGKEAGFT